MKKEMEDPPPQLSKQKKKAITIVVFMSKESYKFWERVKLTTEKEMLFYLPRTMEK